MSWAEVVVAVTAFASAVIGGALFAFSTFVMKSLGRLAPAEGIRAMQRINEDAPQGLMLPLLLSPLGSIVVGALAVTGRGLGDTVLAYQRSWTTWNHVRVVAALAAALLLALALHR